MDARHRLYCGVLVAAGFFFRVVERAEWEECDVCDGAVSSITIFFAPLPGFAPFAAAVVALPCSRANCVSFIAASASMRSASACRMACKFAVSAASAS